MSSASLLSPIRIRLSADMAAVECETCGGTAAMGTEDRILLVAHVRAFLQQHGTCTGTRPG